MLEIVPRHAMIGDTFGFVNKIKPFLLQVLHDQDPFSVVAVVRNRDGESPGEASILFELDQAWHELFIRIHLGFKEATLEYMDKCLSNP